VKSPMGMILNFVFQLRQRPPQQFRNSGNTTKREAKQLRKTNNGSKLTIIKGWKTVLGENGLL
jgi:hypothetical protein